MMELLSIIPSCINIKTQRGTASPDVINYKCISDFDQIFTKLTKLNALTFPSPSEL